MNKETIRIKGHGCYRYCKFGMFFNVSSSLLDMTSDKNERKERKEKKRRKN